MTKKLEEKKRQKNLLIYGTYIEIIREIKRFETLQNSYRVLTSTILLATYAAIGFAFSMKFKFVLVSPLLTVIIICVISLGVLTTFWHLDLCFTERLTISHFVEALKLEKMHKWLPQTHKKMITRDGYYACPSKTVLYYIGSGGIVISTMGIAGVFYANEIHYLLSICCGILTATFITVYAICLKKQSKSYELLRMEIKKK